VADEFTGYPTGYSYGGAPQMPYVPQGTPTPQVSQPYYPYGQQQMQPQQAPTGTAGPPPGGGPGAISPAAPSAGMQTLPAVEQSYIENILRLNKDREVTVYMTFEHAGGGESKTFTGHIEAAGRDHVIINDTKTGTRYLLPLIYLDYVVFQGKVAYSYPFRK
jgi:spore germination protein Q